MEELPEIPVNLVQEESVLNNDLLLVKRLLSVCISFLLVVMSIWIIWVIANDEQSSGPNPIVVKIHSDYSSLVQTDDIPMYTGSGVRVCIVDSGIDLEHPEFSGLTLQGWKHFINDKPAPYDDHGHGTMMAGILVGQKYLKGVAPDVELLVAKALSNEGEGSDEIVGEAIDWCVNSGSDIISLSLGGAPGILPSQFGGDSSSTAANNAISQGVIVIAAAGNDGANSSDNDVSSPAGERDVICVGGVDVDGNLWGGSSIGDNNGRIWPSPILPRNDPNKKPEVVAPAEDVPVIIRGGTWGLANGTSAATVYVTGSMALLLDAREDLRHNGSAGGDQSTVQQIKEWLMESVKPKSGQTSHDNHYGYGMLQARGLLEAAGAPLD